MIGIRSSGLRLGISIKSGPWSAQRLRQRKVHVKRKVEVMGQSGWRSVRVGVRIFAEAVLPLGVVMSEVEQIWPDDPSNIRYLFTLGMYQCEKGEKKITLL